MVTIHVPEMTITNGKSAAPVMYRHLLTAIKETRSFKEGETAECFITKMSDGRFAVTDANFGKFTPHYEVFTEDELHNSFTENAAR